MAAGCKMTDLRDIHGWVVLGWKLGPFCPGFKYSPRVEPGVALDGISQTGEQSCQT